MLILAFHGACKNQGEFEAPEWHACLQKANARDVAALKARLPALRRELDGEPLAASLPLFKKFWTFCYVHHLEGGQKSLPLDTVKLLAPMLIKERGGRFPWAEEWGSYLEALPAGKTVSRDTWSLLPELGAKVAPDLSNYEACGDAWPTALDDFVEFVRRRRGAGGGGGGK